MKKTTGDKVRFYYLKCLNVGTVPTYKMQNTGAVLTFKMYNIETVPMFKMHNVGTKKIMISLYSIPLIEKGRRKREFAQIRKRSQ